MQETRLLSPAPRRTLWPFAQAAFVAAYGALCLYSYYDYWPVMQTLFPNVVYPLIIAFATLTLTRGGYLKRWDGIWLTAFCGWLVIVDWINIPSAYTTYNYMVYQALFFALVGYPLAINLPPARRDGIMRGLLHAFVAVLFAVSAWALVTVLRQQVVQSPFGAAMGLNPEMQNRLLIFMYPNLIAILLATCGLVSIYMLLSVKHWAARVYYARALVLSMVMLGLTDSRTCILAFSAGVACLGVVLVRARGARLHAALRWALALACAAALTFVCFYGMRLAVTLVGYGMQALNPSEATTEAADPAAPTPEAAAQDPSAPVTQPRNIVSDLTTLNQRPAIWRAALTAIGQEPMILLRGTSHQLAMRKVLPYAHMAYDHMHNAFLEVLVSMGVPGLLTVLAFLVLLAIRSVRLLLATDPSVSLAARFLPSVMLATMIIAMVESQLFLTIQRFPNPLFFVIAGYVTALAEGMAVGGEKGVPPAA